MEFVLKYTLKTYEYILGGVLLALIEGIGILFTRYSAEQFRPGKLNFSFVSKAYILNC